MINELSAAHDRSKLLDLVNRLEDKRIDQALPAEIELALLWALSSLGEIEIEPFWWADNRRPDAYTEYLVTGEPAAIEIAAPNDNAISGESAMDRIALEIGKVANSTQKGLGDFLYYRFQERQGYDKGTYFRHRLAPEGYVPSEDIKNRVRTWISSGTCEQSRLRLIDDDLDVEVEKTPYRQTRYHNTWSSMPPETHSIDDNPLFKLLRRKLDQLRSAQEGTKRFIFLGDVGSTLLRRIGQIGEISPTGRTFSGREIISHFVTRHCQSVDAVVVFAPQRPISGFGRSSAHWAVSVFCRPGFTFDLAPLNRVAQALPEPRHEGYQARSLFHQGAFSPSASGWWLGMHLSGLGGGGPMDVKVSARAFMDFLAGRIDVDCFRREMGERNGDKNMFKHWLDMGLTLSAMRIESGGLDEDDDHIVITLADDPGARPLQLPPTD